MCWSMHESSANLQTQFRIKDFQGLGFRVSGRPCTAFLHCVAETCHSTGSLLLRSVTVIKLSHICLLADGSEWRQRIEREAEHFLDVSAWSVSDIAGKISADQIQVAINLNGYTKGARNEIFALLPAPVQTSYMGFPATTGTLPRRPCSS